MRKIRKDLKASNKEYKSWAEMFQRLRSQTKQAIQESGSRDWQLFIQRYEQIKRTLFNL